MNDHDAPTQPAAIDGQTTIPIAAPRPNRIDIARGERGIAWRCTACGSLGIECPDELFAYREANRHECIPPSPAYPTKHIAQAINIAWAAARGQVPAGATHDGWIATVERADAELGAIIRGETNR